MNANANANAIWSVLTESQYYYAVIDSAADNQIVSTIEAYELPYSLLLEKAELSKFFSPVVVKLNAQEPFSEWFLTEGMKKHWGIICASSCSLEEITEHLKYYSQVYNESTNSVALMRFYDPRIFSAFTMLLNDQFITFFEKFDYIIGSAPYKKQVLKKYQMIDNDYQITEMALSESNEQEVESADQNTASSAAASVHDAKYDPEREVTA